MTNKFIGFLIAAALFVSSTAQLRGQGLPGGPSASSAGSMAAMAKLFGGIKGFTAKSEIKIQDGAGTMSMVMDNAFADGKMRNEIDMTQAKGPQIPAEALPFIKQMGMDRIVTIFTGEKKPIQIVYPSLQVYVEMSPPAAQSSEGEAKWDIDTKEIGKESVDGHACIKNKVTLSSGSEKHEITTWNAEDLNKFPIKTQMVEDGKTLVTIYKNIKIGAPDAKVFEAPSGFKKVTQNEIQMIAQQKMMQQLGK
jgi:outer membrane lipoprotein-sorting protein